MLLKTLFIRFYRSFNFDYLKKHSHFEKTQCYRPWETIEVNGEVSWYPYVEIPIFKAITTVVGANESGKSHLLDAIEKGLSRPEDIHRKDFCRYSQFFAVEKGEIRHPDFGYELVVLDGAEQDRLKQILGLGSGSGQSPRLDRVYLFRENKTHLMIYLPDSDDGFVPYALTPEQVKQLSPILPKPFRINPTVAIPNSVPIIKLLEFAREDTINHGIKAENLSIPPGIGTIFAAIERDDRVALTQGLDQLASVKGEEIKTKTADQSQSAKLLNNLYSNFFSPKGSKTPADQKVQEQRHNEAELAYKLICEVANISPIVLGELAEAMLGNDEGFTRGIIERINRALSENLNFPRWWIQDQNFQLVVSARDYDLGFAIRDRTGTEYSFKERSSGLKYFLSYYIQYKAHQPYPGAAELLLMDEPDQYLSSQAQQNLLRVFQSFAEPEDDKRPIQVIYVTHSPFLLDKNYPSRVCVLEKGVEDEGTRVVNDACKNHYEPLRSAFGAFKGETAFIGNCNLILESNAQQILLAGLAQYLTFLPDVSPAETLDLNRFTIISAEGSENLNDVLYFLRGQDIERPLTLAVVSHAVALHEDLLDPKFVLRISDLEGVKPGSGLEAAQELEDLLPVSLVVSAILSYGKSLPNLKIDRATVEALLTQEIAQGRSQFAASQLAFKITRLRFARCVSDVLVEWSQEFPEDTELLATNFKAFFLRINDLEHDAIVAKSSSNLLERVKRQVNTFLQDHPSSAKRSDVRRLLQGLENTVPDATTLEGKAIHERIALLKQDFELGINLMQRVEEFDRLRERLEELKNAALLDTQAPVSTMALEQWSMVAVPLEPSSPLDDIRESEIR